MIFPWFSYQIHLSDEAVEASWHLFIAPMSSRGLPPSPVTALREQFPEPRKKTYKNHNYGGTRYMEISGIKSKLGTGWDWGICSRGRWWFRRRRFWGATTSVGSSGSQWLTPSNYSMSAVTPPERFDIFDLVMLMQALTKDLERWNGHQDSAFQQNWLTWLVLEHPLVSQC